MSPVTQTKVLPGGGAARKGYAKQAPPKKTIAKKKETSGTVNSSQSSTASGSNTAAGRKRKAKGSSVSDDKEVKDKRKLFEEQENEDIEDLLSENYVYDFMSMDENLEEMARHKSRIIEMQFKKLEYIAKLDTEMDKLLKVEEDGEVDFSSDEKRMNLNNLETLLVDVSRVGDKEARDVDEMEEIVRDKLYNLLVDQSNLDAHLAKCNGSAHPKFNAKPMKKPSINPRARATPKKNAANAANAKQENGTDPKVPFPIIAMSTVCPSPAPSVGSTSSYKSGQSQRSVDAGQNGDSRFHRSCKAKNPPTYVFNSRPAPVKESDASVPKKSGENAEVKSSGTPKKGSGGNKLSQSSSKQGTATTESPEGSWCSSSESDDDGEKSPEPTYCLCEKVSHGKMVQCDNELCPIEWFHFKCVNVKKIPKGNWFCPRCRGENASEMKPKTIFLKELAEYNKQKEEEC